MTFPVYFTLFGLRLHAHAVMELLAYTIGMQIYLRTRSRFPRAAIPFEQTMWIIVACVIGALFGSKLLAIVESINDYWAQPNPLAWLGGKTIVGGLLGGWIGVEIAKRYLRVKQSTGDAFVFPLIVGMCLGRVGCFLTGLDDHTCGTLSSLPWAVDFGDGPRHPTQLYEIVFLIALGIALLIRARRPYASGELFRLFMLGYLGFRFAVEFIKPTYKPYLGLSAIQIASLIGAIVCLRWLVTQRRHEISLEGELVEFSS